MRLHPLPGLAPVVGSKNASVSGRFPLRWRRRRVAIAGSRNGGLCLDDGVDHLRTAKADRNPYAAQVAFRQPLGELLPAAACVGALVETASGSRHFSRIPSCESVTPHLIGGGIEGTAIAGIHRHIDHSRVTVDLERMLPGPAPVCRLVYASFLVVPRGAPVPPRRPCRETAGR